jgi:hypothetical protein
VSARRWMVSGVDWLIAGCTRLGPRRARHPPGRAES